MIPMSCPNCGSRREVPLDRLSSRLKCRKCGTTFYMDGTGSILTGDPNVARGRRRRRADSRPAVTMNFGQMVRKIPRPVRLGVPILALVVAIGYGIAMLVASFGLPEDVEGRSSYVGELFVDNKLDGLRAMAVPGTEDDLIKWHEAVRPRLNYEGARRTGKDVFNRAAVMTINDSSAQSFVTLVVTNPAGVSATSPGQEGEGPVNTLTLALSWANTDDRWLVDGTATLDNALKPAEGGRR